MSKENIPSGQLYAFDLEPEFVDMGYELFRDRNKLNATFTSGDLMADPNSSAGRNLKDFDGKMDIVYVSSVLHIWGWNNMMTASKRLIGLTRNSPGSMVVGKQMGSLDAGEYPMPVAEGKNYRHNLASMERFWHDLGKETNTEWDLSAGMYEPAAIKDNKNVSFAKGDPNMRLIWFCATRR